MRFPFSAEPERRGDFTAAEQQVFRHRGHSLHGNARSWSGDAYIVALLILVRLAPQLRDSRETLVAL